MTRARAPPGAAGPVNHRGRGRLLPRPRSSLPIGASSMTLTRIARDTDAESLDELKLGCSGKPLDPGLFA